MLSQLDHIIFPDRCEVYEVIPSQRYVYGIYKNGSSSLLSCSIEHKWKIFFNEQIKRLDSVDIILREPKARLISGINIHLQQLIQQDPTIDRSTALWFIKNYLFLNRHYCPQFLWLINLSRYLRPGTKLNFFDMSELKNIVDQDIKPVGYNEVSQDFVNEVGEIPNIEIYHRLDNVMISQCLGKSLTFEQVIQYIQDADPAAYKFVVGKALKILEPLNALS